MKSLNLLKRNNWLINMGDHIHRHRHVELSDDIILEIFLQLPVKYIFQYRSLSKTSNRLLFDHSFYAQYQRRRRLNRESQQLQLLGFFQGCKSWYWTTIEQEGAPKLSFLPVCKQGMPLTSRPFFWKGLVSSWVSSVVWPFAAAIPWHTLCAILLLTNASFSLVLTGGAIP